MCVNIVFSTVLLLASLTTIHCGETVPETLVEEDHLDFTALGFKHGHPVKEYDVITKDGYILKLFHLPGDRNRPVLLMHGFIDTADTFLIRGRESLAIALADRGYDVWIGNSRGNKYSRRHVKFNPDVDKKFWDYSFHEIGYYDLPALIDFVLLTTGQASLSAVGHSQGNTIFYVLGSTKPQYNSKINVMIAISPVCFLNSPKPPLRTLLFSAPLANAVLKVLGEEEIFGERSALRTFVKLICGSKDFGYSICSPILFLLGGSDPDELEAEFLPVVVAHYPASASWRNAMHFVQVANSKSFSQYDYGVFNNSQMYRSTYPPKYDLSKVKMRVAMLYGDNDGISSLEDLSLLRRSLPNVVEYRQVERKQFNHLDAVWGRTMNVYLFPRIFELLQKYNATRN